MPVNKRAARPPATSLPDSPDDPRGPQTSENDFTVLFQRVSARMFKPPPAKHTAPVKPATIVPPAMRRAPPGQTSAARPAPFFPPSAAPLPEPERRSDRERPTPLVMAMPPANDEVVTVPPSIRVHLIRITVLLTFGCLLGVGVEVLARGQVVASWVAPEESTHVSNAAAKAPLPAGDDSSLVGLAGAGVGERVTLGPVHHHHHKHHAPSASPSAAAPPRVSHDGTGAATDDDDDADVDGGDDLSAAMKTLTKAKEEVTIP